MAFHSNCLIDRIHMKCQYLKISLKNEKNKMSSTEVVISSLKVNIACLLADWLTNVM